MAITLGSLFFFLAVSFVPKVPWWAKILVQAIAGFVIYFGFSETEFLLPSPDTNPIGASLYGGNIAQAWGLPDAPKLAFLSVGFLWPVLGILMTLLVTAGQAIFRKKKVD